MRKAVAYLTPVVRRCDDLDGEGVVECQGAEADVDTLVRMISFRVNRRHAGCRYAYRNL